jgi:hypothetical protein
MRILLRRYAFAVLACAVWYGCNTPGEPNNQPIFEIATIDTALGSTVQTSASLDGAGRVHVAYSQEGASTLRYATCAFSCFADASWEKLTVDTASHSGLDNSIVAAGTGGLHIAYQVYDGQGDLRYATCSAGCTQPGSWQTVTIDSAGNTGHDASLAVDGAGGLHVTYLESAPMAGELWRLKYATCLSSCTTPGSWQVVVLDSAKVLDASSRSLVAQASGRLRLAYQKSDTTSAVPLYYATCDANCETAANWTSVQLDPDPVTAAEPVLALDPVGAPRLDYWGRNGGQAAMVFSACDSACDAAVQWEFLPLRLVTLSSSDIAQHSLLIDAAGRPHATFRDRGMAYASCVSACTLPGSWFEIFADGSTLAGSASSIVILPGGVPGIAYLSPAESSGSLRFAVAQ